MPTKKKQDQADSDDKTTVADLMPTTPDLRAERLAELRRLFPDLFDGEDHLNEKELRQLANPGGAHLKERYEFTWTGKQASKEEAFKPSKAALVYDEKRSVNPEKANGNLIIEGENLEVLKQLTSAYRGRVKLIYIDPPYNTGKDFVYNDNYTEDKKRYWEEAGASEDGVLIDTNTESDGRYHSNWLTSLHARLLAARYLLRPDGFIVVSIDDAEVANLVRLMDLVFDESNRVATLVWDKNRKNDAKFFSVGHEYMLVYAKDKIHLRETETILRADKEGVDEVREEFERLRKEHIDDWEKVREGLLAHYATWEDDDERQPLSRYRKVDAAGPYRDDGNINWPGGGGPRYEILHPLTKKPCKLPISGWRYPTAKRFWEIHEKGRITFGPDESTVPSVRTNLFDSKTQAMRSVLFSYAQTATQEFQNLFDGNKVFDNPKHYDDLRKLVDYLTDEGDIVLDFYAGSGSTAHGVMLANTQRKYILCQFPERITDKTRTGKRALKMGFKKISDITIDRCRRVIEKLKKEEGDLLPDDGLGFKVYTLDKSAFPRVDFVPDPDATEEENVAKLKQYIAEKEASFQMTWDRERIFDEVLLKNGLMLDYTLEDVADFQDNHVQRATDGSGRAYLVCLDDTIAPGSVDLFKKAPYKGQVFICLEKALDSTTKWNLKHHLGDLLRAM